MHMYRVLGIDDHRLFHAGLELLILKTFPSMTFRAVRSIAEALDERDLDPDLILLDVDLDGENGLDGIPLLKLRWPKTLIAVISATIDMDRMGLACAHGVDAFMSKTDPSAQILDVIRTLTNGCGERPVGSDALTRRQSDILRHLHEGLSNKAMARILNISEFTVRGHIQTMMKAFNARTRTEVV